MVIFIAVELGFIDSKLSLALYCYEVHFAAVAMVEKLKFVMVVIVIMITVGFEKVLDYCLFEGSMHFIGSY
jgi:hypothetical protein